MNRAKGRQQLWSSSITPHQADAPDGAPPLGERKDALDTVA